MSLSPGEVNEFLGARLADDLAAYLRKYVVIDDDYRDTVTLWILHCWAIDAFYTTGRLLIVAPEAECGKSLLLERIRDLLDDPLHVANVTAPYIYRTLADRPSVPVLIDEIDKGAGGKNAADSEVQTAVLQIANSGYRRGGKVGRVNGRTMKPEDFPTFAPMAFAGISADFDAPFMSRSIQVSLYKKLPDEENIEYEASAATETEAAALRQRCSTWASSNLNRLEGLEIERPEGLTGRKAEVWLPLFRVAAVLGDAWPARVRKAFEESATGRATVGSTAHELLAATLDIWGEDSWLTVKEMSDRLNRLDDFDFGRWSKGAGISVREVGLRVARYDIRSQRKRVAGEQVRGYAQEQFFHAWDRYLGTREPGTLTEDFNLFSTRPSPSSSSVTTVTSLENSTKGETDESVTVTDNFCHTPSPNGHTAGADCHEPESLSQAAGYDDDEIF